MPRFSPSSLLKCAIAAIAVLSLGVAGLAPVAAVETSGNVIGVVHDDSDNPVEDAIVSIQASDGSWSGYAYTDSSGGYALTGLGLGEARLRVNAPAGSALNTPAQVVTVTTATSVDFVLAALEPLPTGASISQGSSSTSSGVPSVVWGEDFTLTYLGPAGNIGSYVVRQNGVAFEGGQLFEGVTGQYSTTVFALQDQGVLPGIASVTVAVLNGGVFLAFVSFDIYVTPGGTVIDGVGAPLGAVTVTLYRSDSPTGPFSQVPSGSAIMSPGNRANPVITAADGHFGWDVIPGYYKLKTTAVGYFGDDGLVQALTRVIAVPPENIDLSPVMVTAQQLASIFGPVPTISGVAQAGQPLAVTTGTWSPGSVVLAQQWLADGVQIPGANGPTFTPSLSEIGKAITVTVSGTLDSGAPRARTSIPTAAVTTVFADIPTNHTFYTEIGWMRTAAISNGYIELSGLRTYHPSESVTRQAMAAFLYRKAGSPTFTPPATASFTDVPVGAPFFKEIEWMKAQGISTGYPDGSYGATLPVSRQAMAAFLYRAAGSPTYTPPVTASFTDVPVGTTFFKQVEWMKSSAISTGYSEGSGLFSYRPIANVTRQAMAAFLYRTVPH